MTQIDTGAKEARWDLAAFFYNDVDDPRLEDDLVAYEKGAKDFNRTFRGKLATMLGDAIDAYRRLAELETKLHYYLLLRQAIDTGDEAVKTKFAEVGERIAAAESESLTFFILELVALSDENIAGQAKGHRGVAHHLPWIERKRKNKPHLLSEEAESTLSLFRQFGAASWSAYFDEVEADLRFPWGDGEKTISEIVNLLNEDPDRGTRRKAMKVANDVLRRHFLKFSAQSLNTVIGEKRVEDKKRHFSHPMAARNLNNMITDEVVSALHTAVLESVVPLAEEYHLLKAALLGIKGPLYWSDRNAPLPFETGRIIPYDEGLRIVVDAYERFSPTLANMVRTTIAEKRIDAPALPGRRSGAFNASLVLPDGTSTSFTFLNYLGTPRDVMTLAHELGHGVHHTSSGEVQGILQQSAPMAYAETASIFGEMTTYNGLKEMIARDGDTKALLALVMERLSDMMNTVLRQIAFSLFEQETHNAGRRHSPDGFCQIWMKTSRRCYGDIFDLENSHMDTLWCYIPHFHHSPFYVYAYACGALFTQSLYAKQDELGDRFEPLYLDLLRAGGTKGGVALLAPFGLDPRAPSFWKDGIAVGIGEPLREAKELAMKIGVAI